MDKITKEELLEKVVGGEGFDELNKECYNRVLDECSRCHDAAKASGLSDNDLRNALRKCDETAKNEMIRCRHS